jgi:rubredoxin
MDILRIAGCFTALKAMDATDSKTLDRYECRSCGYVYEPAKGDDKGKIAAETLFTDLPITWRCPVCGAKSAAFSNIGPLGNPSGFKENLGFGLGVNVLTPAQKSLLIFGSLGLAILFFLSLYGLQ